MLKRVAALIMVLLFAGQAMAGGIVCGVEAISDGLKQSSLDESGEAVCPMEKSGACDDMACCAQGKSPTGSIVAMICCHHEQIRRIQFHLRHGNAAGENSGGREVVGQTLICPAPKWERTDYMWHVATPYVVTCYKTARRVTKELRLKGIPCSQRAHDLQDFAAFLTFFEPLKMDPLMPHHDPRRPYVRYCSCVAMSLAPI